MENGIYKVTWRDKTELAAYSHQWFLFFGHTTPMQKTHVDYYDPKYELVVGETEMKSTL